MTENEHRTGSPIGPKLLIVSMVCLPIWLLTIVPVCLALMWPIAPVVLKVLLCAVMIGPPLVLVAGTFFGFRSDKRLNTYHRNVSNAEY